MPVGLSRFRTVLALAVLAFSTTASTCLLPHKKEMIEQQSATHNGKEFKVIAVIAGDDSRGGLRMSTLVRRRLNEEGWQGVARSGRWGTENDALADICPEGMASTVDAIVFVYYNQLSLFACKTRILAYQVEGGEELGIEQMAEELFSYLRTGPGEAPAPPAGSRGR